MKEYPILFNGEMVRAVLEGRKTQTRRPVKPQPELPEWKAYPPDPAWYDNDLRAHCGKVRSPYSQSDRLWVRETWADTSFDWEYGTKQEAVYRATDAAYGGPWSPSIHMPRWASRITLEVTGVRVQRVQEISFQDCLGEGFEDGKVWGPPKLFSWAWDRIYAKRGLGWEGNPWVWAISFKQLKPEGAGA